jgi:hypothetical protein
VKRKILGLNSARLYALPVGTVESRREHDDDDRGDGDKRAIYTPVPTNYASRITPELKRILEFPTTTATADNPFTQYANDNLAKIRQAYAEAGGARSNTRYGWLRTRT